MALDLEELDAQLEQLRTQRAGGVSRVVVGADGHADVTYKTDAEMAAAEAALVNRIAALSGAAVTTILVTATKGLE
jgi:hypothetical protein